MSLRGERVRVGRLPVKTPSFLWLMLLSTALLAVVTAAGAESAVVAEHFTLVSMRLLPFRTTTVVDEVWVGRDGRWRLERSSDGWDNGLVVVNDGVRLMAQVPQLSETLVIPASSHPAFVPGFPARENVGEFVPVGEELVLGRRAVLLLGKSGGVQIRRWVDKETGVLLREERLDRHERPVWVQVRNELAAVQEQEGRYKIDVAVVSAAPGAWRAQAVAMWVERHSSCPVRLPAEFPGLLRLEGADVLSQGEAQVIVVRLSQGDRLISAFLAPAIGNPPVSRRLLSRGMHVQARRIGRLDVTLVGFLSKREAELVFAAIAKAQGGR